MQRFLQFNLDLFESTPLPTSPAAKKPATRSPGRRKTPDFKPDSSVVQDARAQFAMDLGVNQAPTLLPTPVSAPVLKPVFPAPSDRSGMSGRPELPPQTLQQALAPATFRHPRASREVLLQGGVLVAYEFKRGKRRTIGFSVGPDGLAVSAPKWVGLAEVDAAVLDKSAWILKKLQETRDRHQRMESARIDWKDGATLPFLGKPVTLVLDPSHAFAGVGAELKTAEADTGTGSGLSLHVGLPHNASAMQIRDAVQAWLMRQAKRIFLERMQHFAPVVGVQWRKLSLSSAGTRWGSASADGSIRLNWRLVHFRQNVIDYVVVHELSHLRVMDHSPQFWDTVRAVVPDYVRLRGQLRDESVPRW